MYLSDAQKGARSMIEGIVTARTECADKAA